MVVSAASGAVGQVVGQLAKIYGCRAVGIAGGPRKCAYVVDELGFDACIDYKAGELPTALAAAVPDGIDVYFENVGGDVLEATIKSKAYFPNEPGNWGYFSFSTPDHTTLKAMADKFPAETCNACHQSSAAQDWVFTQYYPVLRAGRGTGDAATGGKRDKLHRESMSDKNN